MLIKTLVVDDEKIIRKGFIASLSWYELGLTVIGEAGNGAKALEFVGSQDVDLVITDLSMPVMNGFELMERLKEFYPRVHTVVFTCYEDFKCIQDALRLGAIDYIVKTECETDQLEKTMRRIVQRYWESQPPQLLRADRGVETFEETMDTWSSLVWVFNDSVLVSALQQLEVLGLSLSETRNFYRKIHAEWEQSLPGWLSGGDDKFLAPENDQDINGLWKKWLSTVRSYAVRAQLSPEIAISMLTSLQLLKHNVSASQEELSRSVAMSRGYYSHCFKAFFQMTFTDYAKREKLHLARCLLEGTELSIGTIAEQCGFEDHRYFSRLFREKMGCLPSEYRSLRLPLM